MPSINNDVTDELVFKDGGDITVWLYNYSKKAQPISEWYDVISKYGKPKDEVQGEKNIFDNNVYKCTYGNPTAQWRLHFGKIKKRSMYYKMCFISTSFYLRLMLNHLKI